MKNAPSIVSARSIFEMTFKHVTGKPIRTQFDGTYRHNGREIRVYNTHITVDGEKQPGDVEQATNQIARKAKNEQR